MNQLVEYLEQLDLSEIEAKLYLTLLKTGPISVRELAKLVEIKRTTTYVHIDQLVEKGLITKLVRGSQKQIVANEPESALRYLAEQKLESAKTIQAEFPNIISKISSVYPQIKDTGEAEIKYYKGKNGVKKIYEEVLKSKELRSYVDISKIEEIFPENFKLFNGVIRQNPEMKMFEIVENSPQARKYIEFSSKNEKYMQKLLPNDVRLTANDILIYDGKVAIIHLKDKVDGIVLSNIDLYNNFKLLFDFIWKMLPEES